MDQYMENFGRNENNPRPNTKWPNFTWRLTEMTKFDFDTLRPLCKSMPDHWWKAVKAETNTIDPTCWVATNTHQNWVIWEESQILFVAWYIQRVLLWVA